MKKFLLLLVSLLLQFVTAYTQGDSTWSVYHGYGIYRIFPSSDGKYLYCNENDLSRFVKIDAMTGKVIDSVDGKGLIMGISPDWKYLYTCYSTFASVKKLDINTYQAIDSIDNMQDIQEIDSIHKVKYTLTDMKLTADNRIILSVGNGKYIFILLAADNLEILEKILRSNYSQGLDFLGSDQISTSPNGDYFVANYGFRGFDTVKNMGYNWNEDWVWDYKLFKPVKKIFSDSAGGADGARYPLRQFRFSPDGKYFVMNRGIKSGIFNTVDFLLLKEMSISATFTIDNKSNYFIPSIGDRIHYFDFMNFLDICTNIAHKTISFELSNDDRFFFDFSAETGYLTKSRTCIYPVGVSEPISTKDYFISPNPASDYIEINVPRWRWGEHHSAMFTVDKQDNKSGIRIFDLLGVEFTTPAQRATPPYQGGEIRIDVTGLAPGVYFVRVGNEVRKFVKM